MKPATKFVQHNAGVLANQPVWLFSSGPLGTKEKDDQGRDLHEFLEPKKIAEFRATVKPKDHRVFYGAMDASKLGFTHRLICKLPVNRDNALFPLGDFRNWVEVDAWAGGIAQVLIAKYTSVAGIETKCSPGADPCSSFSRKKWSKGGDAANLGIRPALSEKSKQIEYQQDQQNGAKADAAAAGVSPAAIAVVATAAAEYQHQNNNKDD
jgi:hypothetical protein